MSESVDILIVGAGLSGIAAGYYLQTRCPKLSWTIVEARDAIGGTWDLFRYPGVRSDSDMYTLGYRFRPWTGERAIADGAAIRRYIQETACAFGIDRRIRFRQRVRQIAWSTAAARWTVTLEQGSQSRELRCKFLFMCSGYYRYDRGYQPCWEGMEDFAGAIVHPQAWRADLDYSGKRALIIGSGATAVTLAPALAETAAQVTLLQRSPSYIVSMASRDATARRLHRHLPLPLAAALTRWRSLLFQLYFFRRARQKPAETRAELLRQTRAELGADFDIERHFTPRYDPWRQRLCLTPDGELFRAIRAGRVAIATGEIERFVKDGIRLRGGERLPADIIISATGLRMQLLSGIEIVVDGAPIKLGDTLSYKGLMYSGIPNLASAFGYTNASWTLKAELICEYVCRLLNYMRRRGYQQCTPRPAADQQAAEAFIDFSSGYVNRARDSLPKQGTAPPWKVYQNYLKDLLALRYGRLNDGALEFS